MKKDFRICESMETMETMGASAVTTEDLLTIILGNREKAAKLLHQEETLFTGVKDGLSCIAEEDYDGLKYRGDLTKSEAARILASIELGKRIAHMPDTDCTHITSPSDAAKYMMSRLRYETHEKFYVMMLNTKNRVIRVKQISEGSLSSAIVSPQCVYSAAVTAHSSAIIVFHNHPSKITNKSYEDLNLTNALVAAGEVLSIKMLDHIIIGGENFYSFREHGDIQ